MGAAAGDDDGAEGSSLGDGCSVGDDDGGSLGLGEGHPPAVSDGSGEGASLGDGVVLGEGVWLGDGVAEGEGASDRPGTGKAGGDAEDVDELGEADGSGEADADGVVVGSGVPAVVVGSGDPSAPNGVALAAGVGSVGPPSSARAGVGCATSAHTRAASALTRSSVAGRGRGGRTWQAGWADECTVNPFGPSHSKHGTHDGGKGASRRLE